MKAKKILKHDRVLRLGTLFESIDESRFLNAALLDLNQLENLDKLAYYPVNVAHYAATSGTSIGQSYTELLAIVTKARETTLKVPLEDNSTWYTSLIYDVIADETTKSISVRWNQNLIPYISGMMEEGKFCYYDPRLDAVSNVKVYKLTEYIQRNLWRVRLDGCVELSIADIRFYTSSEYIYPEFKELRRHIIQPALDALKKAIGVTLEIHKERGKDSVKLILVKKKSLEDYTW